MWTIDSSGYSAPELIDDWVLSGKRVSDEDIRCFNIRPLPFQVGRRPGLSLMLPGNTVSGIHAEFILEDGKLCLRDLGSTNGTFVNGDRLTEIRVLQDDDRIQFADIPFQLTRSPISDLSRTRTKNACDQALAIVQFDRLITGKAIVSHYQPIVELATGQTVAYEVLARSRLIGLESPAQMFSAAAHLNLSQELSIKLRKVAVEESYRFLEVPHLFLNTHPSELSTSALLESCRELRRISPRQPLTIEMHEAAMTNVDEMMMLREGLDQIGMTLAFDDFGAGQARILEIASVRPHYVKFDRCMIRDLHSAEPSRRRVVAMLVQMILDEGIIPLSECVENAEEAEACAEAGFVLSQGYLHGKPMPAANYMLQQTNEPVP